MDRKLKIVSLMEKSKHAKWVSSSEKWNKYFKLTHFIDTADNLENYIKKGIDVLFLDLPAMKNFPNKLYGEFKKYNQKFKYIVLKEELEELDFEIYKGLVDAILYTKFSKRMEWQSIALLRRYWATHSKPTTIIYKNIIADFIDGEIWVNGKEISLTTKEYKILKFFLENKGEYFKKDYIFKKVWKIQDKDTTRVVDQILFKLKKKIGAENFTISRQNGVKFN